MAYGDQPALICELVDWARTCGFAPVAAGKGTKYLPHYEASTPDTVWDYYGLTFETARLGGMNPQMFNSFLDGTKSAIEMAAVSNATGLLAPRDGLRFVPCGIHDLPAMLKPAADGGILEQSGMVEVVSSEERDGRHVYNDLRWGVYITFKVADDGAKGDYARRCFQEYQVNTDASGEYAALYRPSHLIGQELAVSVASAALRKEPTGTPKAFISDVAAVAKKPLKPGDTLDGEGGFTVRGQLMRAWDALNKGALPIGLASRVTLKNPVKEKQIVGWDDIEIPDDEAFKVRRLMEAS
jgi:predicted homoserine dehydrogenase-like protein